MKIQHFSSFPDFKEGLIIILEFFVSNSYFLIKIFKMKIIFWEILLIFFSASFQVTIFQLIFTFQLFWMFLYNI